MPETPQSWEIGVGQAAEILGFSTRTIRRYVKERKIDYRRVQGKFGEELRFNEEELRRMARTMSNGVGKGRQTSSGQFCQWRQWFPGPGTEPGSSLASLPTNSPTCS